jgi:uncharacterized phage-associated protein
MSYPVNQVANWLIEKANSTDSGDSLTNLKLQKLLYYLQGYYLAVFGKPLFEEEIEAWQYGPVVPNSYDTFSSYGKSALEVTSEGIATFSKEEEELLDEVFEVYNDYSAIGLMHKTHQEPTWRETPIGKGNIIPKEKLSKYFATKIDWNA